MQMNKFWRVIFGLCAVMIFVISSAQTQSQQPGPLSPPAGESTLGPKLKCADLRSLTGYEFTVEVATGFTNGDHFDIRHADKHGNTSPLSTANSSGFRHNAGGEAKAHMWLHPGANAISVTRIAGTGTLEVTVRHQAPFGTV